MASCVKNICVKNICAKNYQNVIIGFQVTVENVGDVYFGTQCMCFMYFLISTL